MNIALIFLYVLRKYLKINRPSRFVPQKNINPQVLNHKYKTTSIKPQVYLFLNLVYSVNLCVKYK